MNPSSQLALEKDIINRTIYSRPRSVCRTRNPITDGDFSTPTRPTKVTVPDYLKEEKKLTDRPKGIAKSVYSSNLQGSLNRSLGLFENYRPTRKHPPEPASGVEATHVPVKKIQRPQTPSRNPILQKEVYNTPTKGKRYGYAQTTSRPVCENQSPNIKEEKLESYYKRNGSSVFREVGTFESGTRKRYLPERPVYTPDILSYQFALSYRDEKLTDKIK